MVKGRVGQAKPGRRGQVNKSKGPLTGSLDDRPQSGAINVVLKFILAVFTAKYAGQLRRLIHAIRRKPPIGARLDAIHRTVRTILLGIFTKVASNGIKFACSESPHIRAEFFKPSIQQVQPV